LSQTLSQISEIAYIFQLLHLYTGVSTLIIENKKGKVILLLSCGGARRKYEGVLRSSQHIN